MHTGGGEGFLVTPDVGRRIFLGLRGEAVTLDGEFCGDGLAADEFLLSLVFEQDLDMVDTFFSMVERKDKTLTCPLAPEGELRVDGENRVAFWNQPGRTRIFQPGQIQNLSDFRQDVEGDDKTHHYFFIAFTVEGEHFYLKGRGRSYDTIPSSNREETENGFRKVLEALRQVAFSRR
jgi:hypothetical protein